MAPGAHGRYANHLVEGTGFDGLACPCAVVAVTQPGCGEQGVGPRFAAGRLVGTARAHQKGVEDDIQERAMSAEIRPDVAFSVEFPRNLNRRLPSLDESLLVPFG